MTKCNFRFTLPKKDEIINEQSLLKRIYDISLVSQVLRSVCELYIYEMRIR